MDQIRESLENIAELSEDEIKSLEDSILKEYESVKDQDPSPEVVETLKSLQTAAKAVKVEKSRRADEAAQLAADVADARSSIEELTAKESDEKSDDDEVVGDSMEAVDAEETITEDVADEVADPAVEDVADEATEEVATDVVDEEEEDKKKDSVEFSAGSESESVSKVATEFASSDTSQDEDSTEKEDFASAEPIVEVAEEAAPEEDVAVEVEEKPEEFSAEASETVVEETDKDNEVAEEFATELKESTEETVTASTIPNPEEASANQFSSASRVKIYAGSDLPGITAGAALSDLSAVAQGFMDRKKGMGRTTGGDGEQALVASIKTSFDSDRELHFNDPEGNRSKIDKVIDGQAIVAAGGLMNPVETSYEIYGLGETGDRPVKDSLAVFKADRGGIRFMTPPVLEDLKEAVSLWTLQDDIDAATEGSSKEKPCLRVSAGVEITVYTDAIPLCLTFGNLGARAYPELVERHLELGMIQHARYAETRLITRLGALSTAVTADAELGAARDILVQVDTAAAGFRSRYRLDPKAPMKAMFPEWFKNALRADLVKQIPGDGQEAAFGLAEATITAWFSARGITPVWFLDGEEGQVFGTQNAGALLQFPSDVIWYLFPDGTFLFLDGGDLDLGLVRDSTLNGTNDYKIFLETFEGLAKVGVESLRITSKLAIAGASAGTVKTI